MKKLLLACWGQRVGKLLLTLLFLAGLAQVANSQTVTGRIASAEKNEPLPGVSVVLKGTAQGTTTDRDGRFSLRVPNKDAVLVVSYIGYVRQEITVGDRTTIDLTLEQDNKSLEEVVVVGYGSQRKANLTGAVSTIDAKVIQNRPSSNLANALQGTTPGLIVTRTSGQPG
jgi:hypothetical protein